MEAPQSLPPRKIKRRLTVALLLTLSMAAAIVTVHGHYYRT